MSGQSGEGVPNTIVVGTDGSETAERAVAKATALAKALGAKLIIVSAYNNRAPSGVAGAGIDIDSGWVAAGQSAAEAVAKESAGGAETAGADVSYRAVAGDPAEVEIHCHGGPTAVALVVDALIGAMQTLW